MYISTYISMHVPALYLHVMDTWRRWRWKVRVGLDFPTRASARRYSTCTGTFCASSSRCRPIATRPPTACQSDRWNRAPTYSPCVYVLYVSRVTYVPAPESQDLRRRVSGTNSTGGGEGGRRKIFTHTHDTIRCFTRRDGAARRPIYVPTFYLRRRASDRWSATYIHTYNNGGCPVSSSKRTCNSGSLSSARGKGGGGGGLFFILFLFLWFFFSSGKRIKLRKEKKKKKSPTAGRRPTPIPLHSTPLHDLNVVRTGREEEGGWKDGWKEERKDGRMEGRMHRTFPFPPADSCDVETPRRMQS